MSKRLLFFLVLAISFAPIFVAKAFEPVGGDVFVTPEFADQRFPYVKYASVWEGTPAHKQDVAVPGAVIVYGGKEANEVVAAAGKMAFYLGNWVDDIGFGVVDVQKGMFPPLILSGEAAMKGDFSRLIVAGSNNRLVDQCGISFNGPSVIEREADGKRFLFVAGGNRAETLDALGYMADVRLNAKSGAYKTFFHFVRLRGYIEAGNIRAAMDVIKGPTGLSACGRNMALASVRIKSAPERIKTHIRHRNGLLYEDIPEALKAGDAALAKKRWHEAMVTCYGCHQGMGEIPQMRKFVPLESIHSKHQRIAEGFGFEKGCGTCHYGKSRQSGY